ncbi:MAG: endoglucanase, partial [Actinomycetota bacterium]|nr:endoglucanase [Actinomycetota bacterium]
MKGGSPVRLHGRWWAVLLLVVLGAASSCGGVSPPDPDASPAASATTTGALSVTVSGNRLVDQHGRTLQLRGVNRSGAQYACTTGPSVFDGPTDAAGIDAMRSWQVTAVRVSLNEQCWLGINGLPVSGDAAGYRRAVTDFVGRLTAAGLVVIVDLHWNAPGDKKALGQQAMADRDHAPDFWRSA